MDPDQSAERDLTRWFSGQRSNLRAPSGLWDRLEPQLGRQDVAPAWQRLFGFRWAAMRLTNRTLTLASAFGVLAAVAAVYVAVSGSDVFRTDDSSTRSERMVSQELWTGSRSQVGPAAQSGTSIVATPAVAQVTSTPLAAMPARTAATATPAASHAITTGEGSIQLYSGSSTAWTMLGGSPSTTVFDGGASNRAWATPQALTRQQAQELLPYIASGGYGLTPEQETLMLERLMRGDWRDLQGVDVPLSLTFFQDYGVNPFVDTATEPISTFAMDVDTASYTVGRGYLESGRVPPPESVRVEEYINYFDQGYPAAVDTLDGHIEGARSPFTDDGRHLLRIGVNARDIDELERKPVNVVLVIDTSGSMNRGNRIRLVQEGVQALLDGMREGDTVGIVSYDTEATLQLRPTSDIRSARSIVDGLRPNGSTNAQAGLRLGFTLAEEAFSVDKNNHVILLSDGVANVGTTEPDDLLDDVKEFARDGIFLSTVGVGIGNFNDVLLEQLANNGDGSYAYIDTPHEARKTLGTDLTGLLEIVARDAKIQVEFDPEAVESYRLVGYENRSLTTEEFRDDSVDAGEVGAGHTVTAMYELKLRDDSSQNLGTVRLRWIDVETGEVIEKERQLTRADVDRSFESASPRFRFTSSVMAFAEIMRRSSWFSEVDVLDVISVMAGAAADLGAATEERELISLLNRAMDLGSFPNE